VKAGHFLAFFLLAMLLAGANAFANEDNEKAVLLNSAEEFAKEDALMNQAYMSQRSYLTDADSRAWFDAA